MKESCRVGRESQYSVADRRGRKSQSQLIRKRVAVADREERKKERKSQYSVVVAIGQSERSRREI